MGGRNPSEEFGEIEVIRSPRGRTYSRIADFLESTLYKYAEFSNDFYRVMQIRELTFGWGEAQNQSIIWHSMRESGLRVLPFSEHSYRLKTENRRLDYWVLLRDIRAVLWVEYKHATAFVDRRRRFDAHNPVINGLNGIAENWESDIWRLQSMTRGTCDDLCLGPPNKEWPVLRVNLLALPICRRIKKSKGQALTKEEKTVVDHQTVCSWRKSILQYWDQMTAPKFIAVWSLHKDLQLLQDWPDCQDKSIVWWDAYYGVYFFAWLDLLSK